MNQESSARRQKTILIVDDDPVITKTTSVKLKSHGYDVMEARDASETLAAIRKTRPHLILLDLSFPPDVAHGTVGWNGFQIMTWLQRLEQARDIPIVIISGSDPAKYKDRCLAAGASAYFHKPIAHEELLKTIDQILGEGAG
ncbi:MAG: response regulator [Verrucomicrobiae bacterium]|nr:response regulator [Verrucomicrobiae bacterium]MDW8310447.1 response regulator [Verrucomicrobiales bacterium]